MHYRQIVKAFLDLILTANEELDSKCKEKSKWEKQIAEIQESIMADTEFVPEKVVERERKLATCLIASDRLVNDINNLTELAYFAGYNTDIIDAIVRLSERIKDV